MPEPGRPVGSCHRASSRFQRQFGHLVDVPSRSERAGTSLRQPLHPGFVRSLLALLPLLIAAVSIMTTFVITLGLTYLTSISPVLEFLIALVGLGVAIDYSLRVVTRWREERARGRDNTSAVIAAMSTAGRASGVLTPVEVLVRPAAAGQPSSGWRRCRVSRPSPRRRRARQ